MSEDQWLLRTLFNLCEPVISVDQDGHIRFMNASARQLLRCDHVDCEGDYLHEGLLIAGDHRKTPLLTLLKQVLTQKHELKIRSGARLQVCDGGEIPIELHASPIENDKKECIGAAILLRDVSEKISAQRDIAESEQRFRYLSEASVEGVVVYEDQRIIECNSALTEITGYCYEDLMGMDPLQLMAKESHQLLAEMLSGGKGGRIEALAVRGGGGPYPVEVTCRPMGRYGSQTNVLVIRDITHQVAREAQRLKEQETLRITLVREAHHRIKNALHGVLNILRMHANHSPEMKYAFDEAISQVRSVALVLELESIERSKDVRLCEVLDALQGANQSLLKSEIVVKKDHRKRCPVLVTKKELVPVALVINELMVNAVKHGGGMPVVVDAKTEHDSTTLTIINHALLLPDGFNFSVGNGLGTGLGLVKSLLPTVGAGLQFLYEDGRVIASLMLSKPVVTIVAENE